MTRKLVTIRRVSEVIKHPNADTLDIVTVDGWKCITKMGNFKPGDYGVYHEVDSFLPTSHPAYADFASQAVDWTDSDGVTHHGYRIKTMKLRKELSCGYLLPLESIFEITEVEGRKYINIPEETLSTLGINNVSDISNSKQE